MTTTKPPQGPEGALESGAAAFGPQALRMLEASHLLVGLVDAEGQLLHTNAALREQMEAATDPVSGLPDLFTSWSRTKIHEAALPAARRLGLWEGGLTLRQPNRSPTVHATLVGAPDDPADESVLALLMPHFGVAASGTGESGDTPDLSSRLAVPLYHETRFLDPGEIVYLEAHGSYTQVYLGEQALLTSLPLSSFVQALPDAFLRVHRSFLVNVRRVHSLLRRENRLFLRLATPSGSEVPVSRRRERQVREVLETAQKVSSTTR